MPISRSGGLRTRLKRNKVNYHKKTSWQTRAFLVVVGYRSASSHNIFFVGVMFVFVTFAD